MGCPNLSKVCQITILIALLALKAGAIADPAFGEDMLKVVQAREILGDIENDVPVNITRATIIGDLVIGGLNLSAVSRDRARAWNSSVDDGMVLIGIPIRIVDSEIRGSVDFSDVFLSDSTEFTGTIFDEDVEFEGAIFARPAQFRGAQFDGNARFLSDNFLEGADFGESQFQEIADFNGAQFCNYAYFRDAQFKSIAQFSGAQFGEDAYFSKTQFDKDGYFGGARFCKDAYFKEAQFNFVDFGKSTFFGYAGFAEAKFYDDAYFWDVKFGGVSDFSNTEFREDAYFENAWFDSSFDLSKSKFDRLYVFWDSVEGALVYDGSTYLSLVRNFKNQERFDDADRCYYQYRRICQSNKDFGRSKIEDVLAWLSCGYGVRPGYTLAWSFIFIVSFGTIICAGKGLEIDSDYYAQPRRNSSEPVDKNHSKTTDNIKKGASEASLLDSIYFSALIFFHTHQPSSWEPSKRWSLWLVLLEDIVGWLLLALFLVALANVIIR
jgi:uncharacterized protein YjbI with pentapeptide repeats